MYRFSNTVSVEYFKDKTTATFPFQRLPWELQLLTLNFILISPTPIIDPGVPPGDQNIQFKGVEEDQQRINPRMIFTCKLFYKEGLPLLYGCNRFIYSDFWALSLSYRLSKSLDRGCPRCLKNTSSPSTLMTAHSPKHHRNRTAHSQKYRCNRNSALPSHATSIQLRLSKTNKYFMTAECEDLLLTLDDFPSLRTLRLDFWDLATGYYGENESTIWYDSMKDSSRVRWIRQLQAAIDKTLTRHHPLDRSGAGEDFLNEIIFTGLPPDKFSLDVVKQFARLLGPDGRMGVRWGPMGEWYDDLLALFFHGRSYELRPNYLKELQQDNGDDDDDDGDDDDDHDVEIQWMNAEEVERWAEREYHSMLVDVHRKW